MLLSMMLILAVTSCALELMIAAKVPVWRRLSAQSPLFNLVNSLFISFIMGVAFGASGLVAMGAGVISTILSVPGYKILYWNYDSPEAKKHPEGMLKYSLPKWKIALGDFFQLIYKILRIITAPIWMTRALLLKYNAYKSRKSAVA